MKSLMIRAWLVVLCLTVCLAAEIVDSSVNPLSEDTTYLSTMEKYIITQGALLEGHQVVTSDQYVLKIFRVKLMNQPTDQTKKGAILFMHGILDSSDCWIINGQNSPALIALKQGYDVWLGNQRGNKYSRLNLRKNPDNIIEDLKSGKNTFWDFSFSEIGKYDLPAMIQYISDKSGFNKVTLVGHSQGSTASFYGMVHKKEFFRERVNLFVALGPVTKISNHTSDLLKYVQDNTNLVAISLDLLGLRELFQAHWMTNRSMKLLCQQISIMCELMSSFLTNTDTTTDQQESFKRYVGQFPSGTSKQQLLHYAQISQADEFIEYEKSKVGHLVQDDLVKYYGKAMTMEGFTKIMQDQKIWNKMFDQYASENVFDKEGQHRVIDLKSINNLGIPIALIVGTHDRISSQIDSRWTRDNFLGHNGSLVYYKEFNGGHGTFMFGKDASIYLDDVMPLINEVNQIGQQQMLKTRQVNPYNFEMPLEEKPAFKKHLQSHSEVLIYDMMKRNAKQHLGIDLDKINQGINKAKDTHKSINNLVKSDFKLDKLADTVQHFAGLYEFWSGDNESEKITKGEQESDDSGQYDGMPILEL